MISTFELDLKGLKVNQHVKYYAAAAAAAAAAVMVTSNYVIVTGRPHSVSYIADGPVFAARVDS